MAVITTLVLADGQATPVNHNFTPVGVKNGIAIWKDKVSGYPAGYPQITYSLREPTKANPAYKAVGKIVLPALDPVTHEKLRESLLNIEAVIPESTSDAERKDLYAYGVGYLASAVLRDGIKITEAVWG